jgi:hypothetical protein
MPQKITLKGETAEALAARLSRSVLGAVGELNPIVGQGGCARPYLAVRWRDEEPAVFILDPYP